ncbi:MAG: hypothetical protein KDI55_00015 [Anaerolineae bacterium]|nr:hypothetical protein [Anaerolineae bacterium]
MTAAVKMKRWSADDIKKLAPRAHPDFVEVLTNDDGWNVITSIAEINTPLRLCHFLAQCLHETGDFTIIRERCTWSAERMAELWPHRFDAKSMTFRARHAACRGDEAALAEMAYGCRARKDLGNIQDGDGFDFRGGGFFQGTGRDWYRMTGEEIGLDLEGQPDLIEQPRVSLLTAINFWRKKDLNRFADSNYGRAIGNAINRGSPFSKHDPIGFRSRQRAFDRCWALFGSGQIPNPTILSIGAHGPAVGDVQIRLRELGYAVGPVDRVFGPEVARGLAAFKADWKRQGGGAVDPDDIVGESTRHALAVAEPIQRDERARMTADELLSAGSTEVATGRSQQRVGNLVAGLGMLGGGVKLASDNGPPQVEFLSQNFGWVPAAHTMMIPVLEGLKWFVGNMIWVVPLIGGVWFWVKGRQIVMARLEAARRGFNLWR